MSVELGCKHPLLLQGPPGPFFYRLAAELDAAGLEVDKVNFNAGDELYYPDRAIAYRGPANEWPKFLRELIVKRGIDAVVLFGDCRPIHKASIQCARELGAEVWVFEEGYLRPDFITLERDGVNGYSCMPRDPAFYLREAAALPEPPPVRPVGQSFFHHAYHAARYGLALAYGAGRFPSYRHHRSYDPWTHIVGWARGGVKKPWHARRERPLMPRLTGPWSSRYFLVPLQVHADYQILEHSSFDTLDEIIDLVARSFAAHAPADTLLVLKHHPMDRGHRDYGALLRTLSRELDLGQRLRSVHDLHLPTLLKHARGVVTVNSTVGISAIHHGAPVKVLGNAIYDFPGLTTQIPLEEFWNEQTPPDRQIYQSFAKYLRWTNQHNGNFYRPLFPRGAGMAWTPPAPRRRAETGEAGAG